MDEPTTFKVDKNLGMGDLNLTLDTYMGMLSDFEKMLKDYPILIVMHPADVADIAAADVVDGTPVFRPGAWSGTETWSRPQVERGSPHVYKSWAMAIMGLKDVLPHSDLVELVRRLESQADCRKEAIDSEVALAVEIIKRGAIDG